MLGSSKENGPRRKEPDCIGALIGKRDATGREPAVALVLEIACSWEAEPPFLAGAPISPMRKFRLFATFFWPATWGQTRNRPF